MIDSLLLPAMVLALLAWLVPKLLSMLLPEGIRPLVLNGVLSSVILCVITGGYFMALYVISGIPFDRILDLGIAGNIVFFGKLALSTALIWGPIMVLSLAGLPRTWVDVVW
ncbi:hypothetical protein AN189_10815 [Loktanella sp. 3ANDIMAR09]|uniref:hypothetical protein n=1 Tax=Loktanella sp. 3ANDIMAR09 TaxID=1225657 RepID=UPI0006FEA122|nr:hypothetical protein [Loktanella sp. 3ANDIMAR09]KQI68297.1 hypothetical protein AN189_10815 [Loktanella sp. 3ANDIMAR09]